jgi:hypothetical protein
MYKLKKYININRKQKLREFRQKRFNKKGNFNRSCAEVAKSIQLNLRRGFTQTFRLWNEMSRDQEARNWTKK